MKLDWVVQEGVRGDVTFECGLQEWVKFSWHQVQYEQRHRYLNELCVLRECMVSTLVGNQLILSVYSGLQNFSHNPHVRSTYSKHLPKTITKMTLLYAVYECNRGLIKSS